MGDLREPNGVVLEESLVTSPSSSCLSSLGPEVWVRAEAATQEIIRQVQPTVVSEERRRDVVDYVQRLLKGYLGCEVFPFGSVPLKTYLPDGDIDLTAFCGFNFEEAFANDVYSVLEAEDRNPAAKFVVRDVQYIRAEVKLVKCLVQNIVVDISFNQIGGLCALCFLEEIDRLIGKDHLFKRSIILIKAWCYYESRILGAHHGLISTYALETLVLYIFHLFHSSLNGPLAVLHKFLDYFSKFDWDNFCVSLSGPIRVTSLPEIVAERPETSSRELLLSDDFMRECVMKFSVPSRGAEVNYRTFAQKFLNIVDPLKENNNLGRSVSKGNFYRIRSAFLYGAKKLGEILLRPQENIGEEVRNFFANTLDRHGNGQRPDVQDHLQLSSCNGFHSQIPLPYDEPYQDQIYAPEEDSVYSDNQSCDSRVGFDDRKHVIVSSFREGGTNLEGSISEHKNGVKELSTSSPVIESSKELSASASHLSGDLNELSTSGIRDLSITEQGGDLCPSVVEETRLPSGDLLSASHLYSPLSLENCKMENGHLEEEQHTDSSLTCSKVAVGRTHSESNGFLSQEEDCSQLCNGSYHLPSTDSNSHHSSLDADAHGWQDSHYEYRGTRSAGTGRHEIADLLPDLSGDVDCHLDNLHHGRWWYDQGFAMPIHPIPLVPPTMFQPVSWDTVQLRQEGPPQMNVNGVVVRPAFFPTNAPAAHFVDEMPKARGIGTYFPIMNHQPYRDRPSPKGRYQGQLKSPRVNGRGPMFLDKNPQAQGPVRQGVGRSKFPDIHESSPRGKVYKETNGFVQAQEKGFEYDPSRNPPSGAALPETETCRPSDSDPSPGTENVEPVILVDNSRLSVNTYRLKDDEDFPPLSS